MRNDFLHTNGFMVRAFSALLCSVFLTACMSSASKPPATQSDSPSLQLSLSEDEQRSKRLREAAIAEIHAKAQAAPYNEQAPDNGYHRAGETTLLTPQEIAEKINRIKAASGQVLPTETDEEVAARQRRMNNLRRKGRNHYNSALRNIEAE